MQKLQRVLDAIEMPSGRFTTRRLARMALMQLSEVVALVSLHLPCDGKRARAYQRETFDPILEAISHATGRCPRCDCRVASWAVPTGYQPAFVPCRSHKREGSAS